MVTTHKMVHNCEEAAAFIREIGILPLANCIPEYPSLESITPKEHWYTGSELDPWGWRNRLAGEGVAAYGKFLKKKSFFISMELFPAVMAVLGKSRTVEDRYKMGLISKHAVRIYEAIKAHPGIETRALRTEVGMKEPESKKAYDRALLELQDFTDIVIVGFMQKMNEHGERKGWNSTSYQLATEWMAEHGRAVTISVEEAKAQLEERLQRTCTEEAYRVLKRALRI